MVGSSILKAAAMFLRTHALADASAALVLASGCANAPPASGPAGACAQGETMREVAELYLGRSTPGGGEVSADQFEAFLADTVTPRFPGFTRISAEGSWEGVRERADKLIFVLAVPAERERLREVALVYKRRFSQQSVLSVVDRACVSFDPERSRVPSR